MNFLDFGRCSEADPFAIISYEKGDRAAQQWIAAGYHLTIMVEEKVDKKVSEKSMYRIQMRRIFDIPHLAAEGISYYCKITPIVNWKLLPKDPMP